VHAYTGNRDRSRCRRKVTDSDWTAVGLLAWFAFIPGCAVWAKLLRGRDPRSLVVTTTYQGDPATAVRGLDNFVPAAVFCGAFAVPLMLAGLFAWSAGMGFLLVPGMCCGIATWLFATGRVGDGTLWLTRDGLTQRANGLEQSICWDDMVAMRAEWDGIELDSSASIKVHRYAPRAWVGRARSVDPTLKLLMGNLPPLYLPSAIHRWVTDEFARLEIGTPEAVQRLLGPRV
jgi:hypothetical protein